MSVTDNTMETNKQPDTSTSTTNATADGVVNPVPSATTSTDDKDGIKMNGSTTTNGNGVKEEPTTEETTSSKPPAASAVATTTTASNGNVETNGNLKVASADVAIKTEEGATKDSNDDDDDDDGQGSVKSEGADEEDALFTNLEQEVEKEEASHPHEQPKDAKAAPKLLQSALVSGDVKMDDSEHGSAIAAAAAAAVADADAKAAAEEEHHIHQRVSFILCSRLSTNDQV